MRPDTIFKVVIFLALTVVMVFNALLYNFCEKQKAEIDSVSSKLDVEAEFNSGKFKYEQDQLRHLTQDLQQTQDQLKEKDEQISQQKDALTEEIQQREQVELKSKDLESLLNQLKMENAGMRRDMKGWQRDYVSALKELETKQDSLTTETKNLEQGLIELDLPGLKSNVSALKIQVEKINEEKSEASQPTISSDNNYENASQVNAIK